MVRTELALGYHLQSPISRSQQCVLVSDQYMVLCEAALPHRTVEEALLLVMLTVKMAVLRRISIAPAWDVISLCIPPPHTHTQ